jgi:peptide/nickel transport system ATP-binding protein
MNIILNADRISYNINKKEILKNISFELQRGLILGISGESGSGKTTIAKIIADIIKPTGGEISFNFTVKERNNKANPVQILFQNTGEIINPLRKVKSTAPSESPSKGKTFEKLLHEIGIDENLWDRRGYELSGGEQQRVALARILAVHPEILILDEPFSAQDFESQNNLVKLFLNLKKNLDITMICISHNLPLLKKLCDEVIIMYNGEIVEKNTTKEIFESPQHPYTKFLLKAEKYDLEYEELKTLKR